MRNAPSAKLTKVCVGDEPKTGRKSIGSRSSIDLWGMAPHPAIDRRPLVRRIREEIVRFSNQQFYRLKHREHGGFCQLRHFSTVRIFLTPKRQEAYFPKKPLSRRRLRGILARVERFVRRLPALFVFRPVTYGEDHRVSASLLFKPPSRGAFFRCRLVVGWMSSTERGRTSLFALSQPPRKTTNRPSMGDADSAQPTSPPTSPSARKQPRVPRTILPKSLVLAELAYAPSSCAPAPPDPNACGSPFPRRTGPLSGGQASPRRQPMVRRSARDMGT